MKRSREIDDDQATDRSTKRAKLAQVEIYDLPEELLLQILVRVSKKNLGTIYEVSKYWQQIARKREFWKLSCQQKWSTIVASDSLDFDQKIYIIPTIIVNGKSLIDWKFYYTLRKKFGKLNRKMVPRLSGLEKIDEADAAMLSASSELHHLAVKKCIDMVEELIAETLAGLSERMYDFLIDWAQLILNRNEAAKFAKLITKMAIMCSSKVIRKGDLFGLCRRTFELCKLIRYPIPLANLFGGAVELLNSITIFDSRAMTLTSLMAEFKIQLGDTDFGHEEIGDFPKFRIPFANGMVLLKNEDLARNRSILNMVFDLATNAYQNSDNWRIKASAVGVAWTYAKANRDYWRSYCNFAMQAAESDTLGLAYAGMVALHNLVTKQDAKTICPPEQLKKMFELFTSSLTRFQLSLAAHFYTDLIQLLPGITSEMITDEVLDSFVSNALLLFEENFTLARGGSGIYAFSKIGDVFKSRLISKLPRIKETYFTVAQSGNLSTEWVLNGYIELGAVVKGKTDFAKEFKQLAKQITSGSLPFEVSTSRCYSFFGDTWFELSETDEERGTVVKALLDAIPPDVYDFGQSGVLSDPPVDGPGAFPETWIELTKTRGLFEGLTNNDPVVKPQYYVSKQHLKPVNPNSISVSEEEAVAMRDIMNKNKGHYPEYAQDLLHALLAALRVVHRPAQCQSVMTMINFVKVEMDPEDLFKYIDIILHTIVETVQHWKEIPTTPATWKEVLSAFFECYTILREIPHLVTSTTICNMINFHIVISDVPTGRVWDVAAQVRDIIFAWPRNAYEGIPKSNLGLWLVRRIKEEEHVARYTTVYSNIGALYGVEYVLEHLCLDDPDALVYEAPHDYLDRIISLCKDLYEEAIVDIMPLAQLEKTLLRNFLIIHALYEVDCSLSQIALIPPLYHDEVEKLKSALTNEKLDTSVLDRELNKLEVDKVCELLRLHMPSDDSDEEEEQEPIESDDDEEQGRSDSEEESKRNNNDNVKSNSNRVKREPASI